MLNIMERFDIGQVFALHNSPNVALGSFQTNGGALMAAVDAFDIRIKGRGGHGAMPHETADPVIAAVGIVQALQSIVSRNHKAIDDLVVSVTQIHTGSAHNVIPDDAWINGTVRTFDPAVQARASRVITLADGRIVEDSDA